MTLVASALACGDCIDDADALRAGESVLAGIPGQRATNDLVVSAFTRTVYSTPGSKSEPTEPKGTLVSTTG